MPCSQPRCDSQISSSPLRHQILTQFMLSQSLCRFAKGVLSGVVPWREARRFFAWRLKRRLTEEGLIRHISSTDVSISRLDAIAMVGPFHVYACAACMCRVYACQRHVTRTEDFVAYRCAMVGLESANSELTVH